MLKFNYFVNLGLATLLVVPAVTLGARQNEPLEQTLRRTLAALDQLAAVEERLAKGDATAISAVLAATEPPLPTPAERPEARDELLGTLRESVALLQGEIELAEGGTTARSGLPVSPSSTTDEPVQVTPAPTTGLDEATRRLLAPRTSPVVQGPTSTPPAVAPSATSRTSTSASTTAQRSFEAEGYAADALRLGRALYRQSRYAEALSTFERQPNDPECGYWRARTLEKLGREAEAITAYGAIAAMENAGVHGTRAKEDLDFLEWRLAFEKGRARTESSKP